MLSVPAMGVCILSIDVQASVAGRGGEPSDLFLADLCRRLAGESISATWSVRRAPGGALRDAMDGHRGCELALLAEASWAAEGASRNLFCQGLADGLAALRSAGLAPTTLSLPRDRLAAHDDVLVRHGIRAVRVAASRQQEPSARRWWRRNKLTTKVVSPLRWGLWEVVANVDLDVTGLAGAARAVDRVARQSGTAVISASATTLQRDATRLSRLVDHLKRRRDENVLLIETVAAAVTRQQAPRPTPARSILRPAA